jgi:hypothetical protein
MIPGSNVVRMRQEMELSENKTKQNKTKTPKPQRDVF